MNIRGINDLNNNVRRGNNNSAPFLSSNSNQDPRGETFLKFLKSIFFPNLTFKSFVFIITIVDIIVYIVTLCYGIDKVGSMPYTRLLAPLKHTLSFADLVIFYLIYRTKRRF